MSTAVVSTRAAEEIAGKVARRVLQSVLDANDQVEAVRAIMAGLNEVFNPNGNATLDAKAAGFAVGIVNVIEVGMANLPLGSVAEMEADHAPA